jgi:phytoene dehydrogenase-like protein
VERETPVSAGRGYDAIVVGAGHNGLAATAMLAKRGLRVLCLEKNAYAGGSDARRDPRRLHPRPSV